MKKLVFGLVVLLCGAIVIRTLVTLQSGLPRHPDELKLKASPFAPPDPDTHRVLLAGAIPAYVGKSRAAPA